MGEVIAGLDVGTNKVIALIGTVNGGRVDIVGVGSCRSSGLRRGSVINIDATARSVKAALHEAELMAGVHVSSVITGVSGSHIRSCNSRGIVAVRDREVTQGDLNRVIDTAKALTIPSDHQIIHVIPQEFILDGQGGVREPIGMAGVRLEVSAHIVTGSTSAIQNIVKCIERCDVAVDSIILQPLASSAAVLSDDEKELGCVLVDIGGGTTDIAIFVDGTIQYSTVIPIAGDQATNDVAVAFRTPARNAEELKLNHASLFPGDGEEQIVITKLGDGNREVSGKMLAEVLRARYQELFSMVANVIKHSGLGSRMNAGVILTGGASKVDGIVTLAERVLNMPVRIGVPKNIGGLVEVVSNPEYATGVGLLLMAAQHVGETNVAEENQEEASEELVSMWQKIKNWLKENF